MTSPRRFPTIALAGALAASTLVACSSGGSDPSDAPASDGPVTITVAVDAGLEQGAKDAFDARVTAFEAEHPNVTVESQEYTWSGTTFAADLAGGTLPDVFTIPFTDGQGLIERRQIADIHDLVGKLPYAGEFNPNIAKAGQSTDGQMWAVPVAAYGQGLHYNRALFEQAGLDPDTPPTTWAEVRSAARQISERTGQAGYAEMTKDNTGGWILTTLAYALGGRAETVSADATTATIDTPQYAQALRMLKDMRWQDDSMGDNFLYDWPTSHADFAAGKIGMFVSGGGDYGNLVTQNAMEPADYGVTVLPLEGSGAAVLGGGTLAAVSAKADPAQQAASVEWIDFYYLGKLTDREAAVADAKTTAEADQPVGAPQLPVFDKATYDEQQGWIEDYVNVPVEQFAPFTSSIFDQPLESEPPVATQELYAALDPVVQAVLTDEDADIAGLLKAAQQDVQSRIDRS
ncbi:extracellular solute-binding protein [Phycicoccus sp. CSK15P-2]|uniref:ABC transporter substrate-binding protein n=1 Tax=Phycicoccus sp. CSK15P-2 TaxID=2807627 RepID=UPI001950CED4|nr:extracellular solute-binding protein [Phycicoccus sp. CSK15P-2]MBM6403207.1 extracellular solute-binding protein [Phycicoccus sp. CSK15P-2]